MEDMHYISWSGCWLYFYIYIQNTSDSITDFMRIQLFLYVTTKS